MLILVCGSRDWGDRNAIWLEMGGHGWPLPTIMHGAASRKDAVTGDEMSADMLADSVAREYGFPVRAFLADWAAHPRRAGILRNLAMLDERPDLVIAFQRGGSRGTQHTIDEALRRGIRTVVVRRP